MNYALLHQPIVSQYVTNLSQRENRTLTVDDWLLYSKYSGVKQLSVFPFIADAAVVEDKVTLIGGDDVAMKAESFGVGHSTVSMDLELVKNMR